MQFSQQPSPSFCELISRLDGFETCDPEFDAVYDDLDREFQHLRLHRDANEGGAYVA